jgi:predicted nucleic acid-binding protein
MILLDTNVLSELMRPQPETKVVAWVDAQLTTTLFISSVTRAEIELGLALLPEGKRRRMLESAAQGMFQMFAGRCLEFGEAAASVYARIVSLRIQAGSPITVEDAQIASIAIVYGLDLATRNTKDFSDITGLTLINPWV